MVETNDATSTASTVVHTKTKQHQRKQSVGGKYNNKKNGRNLDIDKKQKQMATLKVTTLNSSLLKNGKKRTNKKPVQTAGTASTLGAYSNYTISQLLQYTEDLLATEEKMNPSELHECHRLMSSWAKRCVFNSGVMAEKLLMRVIKERDTGNEKAFPSANMYNTVINAWAKCGDPNGPSKATSILELMEQRHNQDNMNAEPLTKCYVSAIDGWCKSSSYSISSNSNDRNSRNNHQRKKGAQKNNQNQRCKGKSITSESSAEMAECLLDKLGKLPDNTRHVKHFNVVMNAWAETIISNSGKKAEEILSKLIDAYNSQNSPLHLKPNKTSYNTVIKAWGNSALSAQQKRYTNNINHGVRAAQKAEQILSYMEEQYEKHNDADLKPDRITYTSVLLAWANSGEKNIAPKRAEEILEKMERLNQRELQLEMSSSSSNKWRQEQSIKPDTVAYNSVIKVWANSGHAQAGEKSESLLNRMEKIYQETGDKSIRPDNISFNSVIHALANSGVPSTSSKSTSGRSKNSGRSRNNGVNNSKKKGVVVVGKGSAHRALAVLERMEALHAAGDIKMKPDIVTYNSVMNALAKSREMGAAQNAEEILERLERLYQRGLSNVRPDAYSYNIVISAWANSGDIFAAARAETLVQQMKDKYHQGDGRVKPDTMTYNSLLTVWSRTAEKHSASKAESILETMIELYESGDTSVKPDAHSFTTVINAWSKSRERGKAQKAESLLRKMEEFYKSGNKNAKPNVFVYATVLNACAYTFGDQEEKEEALDIAIKVFGELQKSRYTQPNHVTYATFLKVCGNLMVTNDNRKKPLVSYVFQQCCKDGQVGDAVLNHLIKIVSPNLLNELLGDYYIDGEGGEGASIIHGKATKEVGAGTGAKSGFIVTADDLPPEWTCNVRERKNFRMVPNCNSKIKGSW